MKLASREAKRPGKSLALVPTMGALHEGHLSLIRRAKRQCDEIVVSIFVNPRQFNSAEDLERYPRDLARDLDLLLAEKTTFVFTPSAEQMYPESFAVSVDVGPVARRLEGSSRPGHFQGVATVVLKLLNIVRPDIAYFGQKDFQQAMVIRRLIQELNLDARLVIAPIMRDPDGLALSSRNALLGAEDRQAALVLSRSLEHARRRVEAGESDARAVEAEIVRMVGAESRVTLDYAEVVNPADFLPAERVAPGSVAVVAARVGEVRLIDNLIFGPPDASPDRLIELAMAAAPVLATNARVPGLEAETLRQRVAACRRCAALSSVMLPPREFLAQYIHRDYPDLSAVRALVIGRDAPANAVHFLYHEPNGQTPFAQRLFELLNVADFDEFKKRYALTDSIRCHATGPRVPAKAMEYCAEFLASELKLFPNLETLVVLGQDAYFAVQRELMGRAADQIPSFDLLVGERGWARESIQIPAVGQRALQVYYCHHPTRSYVRTPSLGDVLKA